MHHLCTINKLFWIWHFLEDNFLDFKTKSTQILAGVQKITLQTLKVLAEKWLKDNGLHEVPKLSNIPCTQTGCSSFWSDLQPGLYQQPRYQTWSDLLDTSESLEPWPHPRAVNQHVLLSWATTEPPLTQTCTAKPSAPSHSEQIFHHRLQPQPPGPWHCFLHRQVLLAQQHTESHNSHYCSTTNAAAKHW